MLSTDCDRHLLTGIIRDLACALKHTHAHTHIPQIPLLECPALQRLGSYVTTVTVACGTKVKEYFYFEKRIVKMTGLFEYSAV